MADFRRAFGDRGEGEAAQYLRRKGYAILVQKYRTPLGELDLVARDGRTVVFVEVKTRRSPAFGVPQAAVDLRKQQRMGRIALYYLQQNKLHGVPCRFDVVAITASGGGRPSIQHIPDAFQLTGGFG